MASLTIEGIPRPVTVDPSFASLSPQDQASTVDHIRAAWVAQEGSKGQRLLSDAEVFGAAPSPSGGRLMTDAEVFGTAPASRPSGPADRSIFSAIRHGLDNETEGLAATARVLGAKETAEGISETIAAPRRYEAATPELVEALRGIDLRRAAGLLPRAIAEQAPGLAGTLAAGSAGAALGSVVPGIGTVLGGLAGASIYSAGRGFGQNVEDRARNNGHAEPTATDYAGGAATTAASAALDAVGARGLGRAVSGGGGLLRRAQQVSATAGREASTEAAQEVVQEVGTTLGTERGLELDPAQIAGAAVLGGATRATLAAPGMVRETAAAGVRAAAEGAVRREVGDLTPERAASFERVNQALMSRTAETGGQADTAVHLRSIGAELDGQMTRTLRDARGAGWLDADQHGELTDLLTNAKRHNQELSEGRVSDDGTASGLAQLDAMDNLPPAFREAFRAQLVDRNTVSTSLRPGAGAGPFERLGQNVGKAAVGLGGFVSHGPIGTVAAVMTAGRAGARVGGSVGRFLDSRVGASEPTVVKARQLALAELERAGVADPGSMADQARHIDAVLTDKSRAARAAVGLATDEASMAREAAQMARKRAEWTRRRIADGLDVTEAELGNLSDRDRVDVLERMRFETDRAAAQAPQAEAAGVSQLEREATAAATARRVQEEAAWSQAAGQRQQAEQRGADYNAALAEVDRRVRLEQAGKASTAVAGSVPPTPGTAPSAVPGAVPGAVPSTPTGMPSGWAHGVVRFASDHRGVHNLGISDAHAALERLVERGDVSEDIAEAARKGDRIGRDTLERVTAEALAGAGVDPDRPYAQRGAGAGSGAAPNGGDRPVRNLTQYQSAASGYQGAAERASQRAHADGDFELVALVETLAAATETDFPPAARLQEAAELVSAAADDVQRLKRQAALAPLLRRYQSGITI